MIFKYENALKHMQSQTKMAWELCIVYRDTKCIWKQRIKKNVIYILTTSISQSNAWLLNKRTSIDLDFRRIPILPYLLHSLQNRVVLLEDRPSNCNTPKRWCSSYLSITFTTLMPGETNKTQVLFPPILCIDSIGQSCQIFLGGFR
jgi:hypothetical protein